MKILVTLKPVPDPEQKIKLKNNMSDTEDVGFIINPFDEYALETALRLNENNAGSKPVIKDEIYVLSIGTAKISEKILRKALAMGATEAIHVEADVEELDFIGTAKIIAYVCEKIKPDLVITGKQSSDGDASQVAAYLSEYLDLPLSSYCFYIKDEGDKIVTGREVDNGIEYKTLPKPAVVTVDLRIVLPESVISIYGLNSTKPYADSPRYPSVKGFLAAKRKKITKISLDEVNFDFVKTVEYKSFEIPPERKAGIMVETVADLFNHIKKSVK